LRHLRHVVAVTGAIADRPTLAALMATEPDACEAEPMGPDLPAFWLYTSGSTGRPKAAVHLHRSMVSVVECYAKRVLDLRADDLGFSTPKMFFAYGLGNSLYFPPAVGGAAVILAGPPTPARVFEALERFQPTLFYSVPAVYNALLATYEGWLEGRGTPPPRLPRPARLRCCVSAGEWLPPEIYQRWKRHFGVEILDGIGSTEMLHFYLHSRPGRVRPGSTGTPVPGYEAKLVDERGAAVREGEIGVLLAKGESSAPYYWNNREKTRATMLGEWVVTGDQFHRDADGYFWYHGRNDDMMKVGGSWVSPIEVENALLTHPAVAECGVVGLRDESRLTRPKAFVVLREGWRAEAELVETLRRHAAERLLPHKVPQWVAFVERLPRTATGKLQRFELRAEGPV
jgi:benzoate-CoA ligase